MMSRFAKSLIVCLALTATTASACPMCKAANEAPQPDGTGMSDPNMRPRAYMYSIFFMMSMPPIAGGIIFFALRRDVRRARAATAIA